MSSSGTTVKPSLNFVCIKWEHPLTKGTEIVCVFSRVCVCESMTLWNSPLSFLMCGGGHFNDLRYSSSPVDKLITCIFAGEQALYCRTVKYIHPV